VRRRLACGLLTGALVGIIGADELLFSLTDAAAAAAAAAVEVL